MGCCRTGGSPAFYVDDGRRVRAMFYDPVTVDGVVLRVVRPLEGMDRRPRVLVDGHPVVSRADPCPTCGRTLLS